MEKFLDYFAPQSYRLQLTIDRSKNSLHGQVTIVGQARAHADQLKLHAVAMSLKSLQYCTISAKTGKLNSFRDCAFSYDGEVIAIPRSALGDLEDDQNFALQIEYSAELDNNMQGCYLSSYEHGGQTRFLATTQFESHYARNAFPCIDEPAAKATFDLTLHIPDLAQDDVVLSNMPVSEHHDAEFTFETTPRMSTYLLAWVIGPLQSISATNQHGVKVTTYAALNQSPDSLTFANDTAAKALDYYDDKFGIKYPLPKLDQVALPDFEAGAMENWGLVTYRESMMLADPNAALDVRESVATTVTHELSHQWFGNLVTMAWWDDLWLNESFATIMEYFATDALYPDYKIWEEFYTGECLAALKRDALDGVQAVKQPVHDPAEISTLFDGAIVYAKSARLVLMLIKNLMGEDNFFKGLHDYFERHAYQNTVDDDLWNALQPYADFNVKDFMHTWISQPGYPKATTDGQQTRFFMDGHIQDMTEHWPLPHLSDDMSVHYLLSLSDQEFHDKLQTADQLSVEQQLRLIIDRMLLARTPAVNSASLLGLLDKFASTSSAAVLDIIMMVIGDLKLFFLPEADAAKSYKQYLRQLFSARFQKLDLTSQDLDSNQLKTRDILLSVAYYAEDEPTLQRLARLYQSDLAKIDPSLRLHVLGAKLYFDEQNTFPHLLEVYQQTSDPELRSTLLVIMASGAKLESSLNRLTKLLSEPTIVRPQDHIFLYIYLLRNFRTRGRTLTWLTENWDYVKGITGDKSIEDYPRYAANILRTPDEAAIFYNFFDKYAEDPILSRTLKMAHGEIDTRLNLIELDTEPVQQELQKLLK